MSYLTMAKKAREEYRRKQQAAADPHPGGLNSLNSLNSQAVQARPEVPTVDLIVDETVVAVLIDSEILGAPVWFALRDGWKPDDGDTPPVFYASELPALRTRSPERLRTLFEQKTAVGGKVRK